jgi:hypothetical protein
MTAAAYRVVEWVPAGVSVKTCAAPIIRAMIAEGAGWCCWDVIRCGATDEMRPVLVVRGWHEEPDYQPPPVVWEDVFPDPVQIARDDALKVLEAEIRRRRGIIATLGQILANTEAEERELAALRAVHLRLLETPA